MESIDQGAATSSHVEENMVVESGDQLASYVTPLVQQPPMGDTSFHAPVEGHFNSPIHLDYGPDAPFWGTSMGQAIASFGVNRPSPEQSSPSEEEYRQIQASIHRARDFQERMQRSYTILATLVPHKEPIWLFFPIIWILGQSDIVQWLIL